MDLKTLKEKCEGVILVEELPSLSKLRQKVAGCYEVFGMCPVGEIIALDVQGKVNCLKADISSGEHLCEEDGSPCLFDAEPTDILGVMKLLRHFLVENFVTKEGILSSRPEREETGQGPGIRENTGKAVLERDYRDEDLGISQHLSEDEKIKMRQAAKKEK